jgi:hypothetical protein
MEWMGFSGEEFLGYRFLEGYFAERFQNLNWNIYGNDW